MAQDSGLSGFFFIDKEHGMTSHDVVARMRKILNIKKIGHAGTLDPMATGVLAMGVGTSTRLLDYVQAGIKTYIADLAFGTKTSTGDIEGEVIETIEMPDLDEEKLKNACEKFIGEIEQIPPMASAVKVDGKELYKYARQGIEVERKIRKTKIYSIEILEFISDTKFPSAKLKIVCSVGTYVRTLAEDIAVSLNGVAHLSNLRRTKSGSINETDLISLDDLRNADNPFDLLCTPQKALSHYKSISLTSEQIEEVYTGRLLKLDDDQAQDLKESSDELFFGIGNGSRSLLAMYDNPYLEDNKFDFSKRKLKSRCVIFLDL